MLPNTFSFKKSLEVRRKDYLDLKVSEISCCNILNYWSFQMELVIGCLTEFKALWQLDEDSCIEFKILYPASVIVVVKEVIFNGLLAIIEIKEVSEDLSNLPDTLQVPLFELLPLQAQNNVPCRTLRNVAEWLDSCRFFFLYLWYPWDSSKDQTIKEWADKHLEARLKLTVAEATVLARNLPYVPHYTTLGIHPQHQYDIQNGLPDKSTARYIQSLIKEALQVVDTLDQCENIDIEDKLVTISALTRKKNIKLLLELFETDAFRDATVLYIRQQKNIKIEENTVALVGARGTVTELMILLEKVRSHVDQNTNLNILSETSDVLDNVLHGDTVFFGPGRFQLQGLGNISFGGVLKGVGQPTDTVLAACNIYPSRFMFLQCQGDVQFQNVTIERSEGVLISSSRGKVRLESCHLIGHTADCSARGVVVQPGCSLELVNCKLMNLSTGIIAKAKSQVSLESCEVIDCGIGIKFMDESKIMLVNVNIEGCTVAGVVLETNSARECASGPIDILSNEVITKESTKFTNNKVDALVDLLAHEAETVD